MATTKTQKQKEKLTSVDKNAEKLKPLCAVGRNLKWCNHCE
jgi:hypothetical protein